MNIVVVEKTIPLVELQEIAKEFYVDMIKGVVDIESGITAFGGEYHADANAKLIEQGSVQKDVWGFNIYLNQPRETWLEYTSLINIRPGINTDMEIQDPDIRRGSKISSTQKSYDS